MKKISLLLILALNINASASITETEFTDVINEIIELYKDELPSKIDLDIDWDSKVANASAGRDKLGGVSFTFHGEYARKNNLTKDGFALTVCHELGHIIGGYPKVYPTAKYTSEAQADYFAALECLPKYFGNNFYEKGLDAIKNASNSYPRGSFDSEASEEPDFTIFNDYPSDQCRIDTLKAGLNKLERPRCWFNGFAPQTQYLPTYEFKEALIIAKVDSVEFTQIGCKYTISFLDYWQPSYLYPLSESKIINRGINEVSGCRYSEGDNVSGTVSMYLNELFLNLNPTDK